MAEQGREDGHGNERGEGGSEDEHSVVTHCHERSDEEGFVADFGKEDHGKGEDEGVHGLDDRAWFFAVRWRRGLGVSVVGAAIFGLDGGVFVRDGVFWRRNIVRLLREICRFL